MTNDEGEIRELMEEDFALFVPFSQRIMRVARRPVGVALVTINLMELGQ